MKTLRLTATLVVATLLGTSASSQELFDITDHYLENAGFDMSYDYDAASAGDVENVLNDVAGWNRGKNTTSKAFAVVATFQYGSKATFYGATAPTLSPDGSAEGGCLVMCGAFKKKYVYYQDVTLPAGNYRIVAQTMNCNAESGEGHSLVGWIPVSGQQAMSQADQFAYGEWLTDTIAFELEATTKGTIQVGLEAVAGMTEMSAMLAFHSVRLLRDTPFGEADVTGDKPDVKTDKRYARGATMAFGRMSATIGDGTISERGFCWAEHPEPTVDDNTTTEYLSNNGNIYWLKNLKPATKYYMRAYAKTDGRQVGYGEVIKFYTLPKGQITFTIRENDVENTARIRKAAQTAIDWWNNLTEMKGFSPNIGYESGTPTADCSYGGWMRVGSNTSYQRPGTIMHEMLHGCGVIPWADTEWSRFNLRAGTSNAAGFTTGSGQWLGDRVTEVLRFWDNSTTSRLSGDYQHMWPYGINGASEDNGSDVLYIGNGLICQALGEDGLQHTSSLFAEPYYAFNHEDTIKYYLKNEDEGHGLYTSYLMPDEKGTLTWRSMTVDEVTANDSAAWMLSFTPSNQYYQLRNAATGQYMTYASGSIRTATRATLTSAENFHMMKGRIDVGGNGTNPMRGYWLIHPTSNWTPPCLQADADGSTSSKTFDIANSATAQRWLIMTQEELQMFEHEAVVQLKRQMANVLQPIKALYDVPHQAADGADEDFCNAISDIEQKMNDATSSSDLMPLFNRATDVAYAFLCQATPTDAARPFNLTYMVRNAGLDDTEGWSLSPTVNYSCAEFYQTTFDFNQTLTHMPSGTYAVHAQGFQRPGSSTDAYGSYAMGTNNVNAYIYGGTKSVRMAHVASEAQKQRLGGSEAAVGSGLYMPNDMQSASIYFARGLYENRVVTTTDHDGESLRIGLRCSSMPTYYWCIFDNFRLFFYGSTTPEQLAAIKDAWTVAPNTTNRIFGLDGRRMSDSARLAPGIYIVNGKKVVVKE